MSPAATPARSGALKPRQAGSAAEATADPAGWIMLDGFTMERQCHTKWCWAAVAQAVAHYYNAPGINTQRDIAKLLNLEVDANDTCYTGDTIAQDNALPYNREQLLMSALLQIHCLDHVHTTPDEPAPLPEVQAWINGDPKGRRAVCVRIRWPDRAHFVAITGYRPGTNLLRVADPWGPQSRNITYSELSEHYTSVDGRLVDATLDGKWVDTFFTKRPS